ncbi:MAG TPA: SDR family oxidoreductase [Steroidobacteraceae bacterium]|nr:SDR family oxidoreductase [Steroidobacteraceae bacterium]
MHPTFDLHGKVALVTGASGGLGSRFATVLAKAGARVGLAARRVADLEALAQEIRSAGGIAAVAKLDVRDRASVEEAVRSIEADLGPISILVNNSGVSIGRPVLEQTEQDWDDVIDVNLKGAFLVATEVARRMRVTQTPGSIINIESIVSFRQAGHIAPYAISKAGLTQLTRTMALELARYQIRVNGIAPGYIRTDINRDFFATEAGAAMIKRIPQRRLGNPEDLDGPLLLLASDASRFMTGSTIVVDGGHLCGNL